MDPFFMDTPENVEFSAREITNLANLIRSEYANVKGSLTEADERELAQYLLSSSLPIWLVNAIKSIYNEKNPGAGPSNNGFETYHTPLPTPSDGSKEKCPNCDRVGEPSIEDGKFVCTNPASECGVLHFKDGDVIMWSIQNGNYDRKPQWKPGRGPQSSVHLCPNCKTPGQPRGLGQYFCPALSSKCQVHRFTSDGKVLY